MSLHPITKETKGKRKRELHPEAKAINMVYLHPRDEIVHNASSPRNPIGVKDVKDQLRPQPEREAKIIQIRESKDQTIKIGNHLLVDLEQQLIKLLQDNKDLFAWTTANMPGVEPSFCCHHLNMHPGTKPVAQKKSKMGSEKRLAPTKQIEELLKAGTIYEL